MGPAGPFLTAIVLAVVLLTETAARADLTHDAVSGRAVTRVTIDEATVDWPALARPKKPALYTVSFEARGASVEIPHCNGRERVTIDGRIRDPGSKGPLVLPLDGRAEMAHEVKVEIRASPYEKRLACSGPPLVGAAIRGADGLATLRFDSPHEGKGGGTAVVFVPGGHDRGKPSALLVGTHPWNGTPWTYAAYAELLEEAGKRDVVLLMPSGLGNSLYVEDAEDEVMRAIDATSRELAIDPQRVSIWGASMGGAGATTIAFHRPERFAFVASYFGDSRYDLTTYVNTILGGEEGARRVNALDVLENGRHLPVLLVHGEDDRISSMKQSTMLYDAMHAAGFEVELVRAQGMGHEGPLVVREIRRVVARAAEARATVHPSRVSFRSVRASDTEAYGVTIRPPRGPSGAPAFVDLELRADGVHLLAAEGVAEVILAKGALGATDAPSEVPIVYDAPGARPVVRWVP
jgi:pimeloyl-ACP methyl ester carboxylesterase